MTRRRRQSIASAKKTKPIEKPKVVIPTIPQAIKTTTAQRLSGDLQFAALNEAIQNAARQAGEQDALMPEPVSRDPASLILWAQENERILQTRTTQRCVAIFKGTGCPYTGPETECNKTIQNCTRLFSRSATIPFNG